MKSLHFYTSIYKNNIFLKYSALKSGLTYYQNMNLLKLKLIAKHN